MKKFKALLSFSILGCLIWNCSTNLNAQNNYGLNTYGDDAIKLKAIRVVENHFELLQNLQQPGNIDMYKSFFITNNATHPCDICSSGESMGIAQYVSKVTSAYPNGFDFTYDFDVAQIELLRTDGAKYRLVIPFSKEIKGVYSSKGDFNNEKTHTEFLSVPVIINLDVETDFGLESYFVQKPPSASLWMVELNGLYGLSKASYDNQVGLSGDNSSFFIKSGLVYYFNPFTVVNTANVWFKTGLRLSYLNRSLDNIKADYIENEVSLDGSSNDMPHEIDLGHHISDASETVHSIGIEIPLGISKRFLLSPKYDLAFEVEASYTLEISESISGNYNADLEGSNHYLNGDIQSANGGAPVVYGNSPQAVRTAAGEDIYFYSNQIGLFDNNETDAQGYLSFAFRPSLFVKERELIKYNFGLVFGYSLIPSREYNVTSGYFNPNGGDALPSLVEVADSQNLFSIGFTAAIKL